ncbi:DUF952 domain-containing protein [Hymenobacter sp. J193]|uniref:DUF952 domain-containing protein n=1 Tax=Hymenobacter sp. J193 TaxID=2898429 RepID=UPI00215154BC|nr:DUF952 domain-containing protein [Hymenobacter sp. J193]MCR5886732.1 DUF952 domain-containing protein [Hymenobacter sp. J193]
MLYRIARPADWAAAQHTSFFASPDLAAEGFIHASELSQVLDTARKHYQNSPDAVLLEIDEAALATAQVRVEREWAESRQAYFPHIFAPIPLSAVARSWPFPVDEAGRAALPKDLG